ncbi:MAG: hypothetical protein R3E96_01675 [Planctomycetota bacterium]
MLASTYLEMGNSNGAADVALRHFMSQGSSPDLAARLQGKWIGWWAPKWGFDPKKSQQLSLITDRDIAIARWNVPAGQGAVRIDLPAFIHASLRLLSVEAKVGERREAIELQPQLLRTNDLDLSAWPLWAATGLPDPFVAFELPADLVGKALEVEMTFKVNLQETWISDSLNSQSARDWIFTLPAQDSRMKLKSFLEFVKLNLVYTGFSVRAGDRRFTANAEWSNQPGRLDWTVQVDGSVLQDGHDLVLELSPAPGMEVGGVSAKWGNDNTGPSFQIVATGYQSPQAGQWNATDPQGVLAVRLNRDSETNSGSPLILRGWIQ